VSIKNWLTRIGSFRFPGCVACRLVGGSSLSVDREVPGLRLTWTTAVNATHYEVVAGNLSTLRSTLGDFTAAAPGDGKYYLVRPIGTGCRGTYDDGSASQQGGRDAETASAAIACP